MSRIHVFQFFAQKSLPNRWDLMALLVSFAILASFVYVSKDMIAPLSTLEQPDLSLDYSALPYYALRTTLRMFAALICSLFFTFTYATFAAKSKRGEMILIPLLDILQSVPILGFLSFTVTFFLGLFPGSVLGAECASIFVVFTSQAWNMAFSFHHSLRTIPRILDEVARSFNLSPWQKFWQLETPCAIPNLVYNMMMSMSGGWFFVVASEAITVGDTDLKLPGIGSYLALAIEQRRIDAVGAAVFMVLCIIFLCDQLFFRPMLAWSDKFRLELSKQEEFHRPFILNLLGRTRWLRRLFYIPARFFHMIAQYRFEFLTPFHPTPSSHHTRIPRTTNWGDFLWALLILSLVVWASCSIYTFVHAELTWADVGEVFFLTSATLLRIVIMMILATLFWIPIGVWIGLRPTLATILQPLAQFLAAFPANVLFPLVVVTILHFHLTPDIWLSFLIIFGTQWYIVFNVIAGAASFPAELKEVTSSFQIRGWGWWRDVMLPGIFPSYMTGAMTAWGGSWNASIVAEYVKWGDDRILAHGIGAYLAQATETGQYPKIALAIAVMCLFITGFNRLFWHPLRAFAENHFRLEPDA